MQDTPLFKSSVLCHTLQDCWWLCSCFMEKGGGLRGELWQPSQCTSPTAAHSSTFSCTWPSRMLLWLKHAPGSSHATPCSPMCPGSCLCHLQSQHPSALYFLQLPLHLPASFKGKTPRRELAELTVSNSSFSTFCSHWTDPLSPIRVSFHG